jgi:stage II sporulation protein AB (anti-sigma F factor)
LQELSQTAEEQRISKEITFPGDTESMSAARDEVMEFIQPHCPSELEETDILIALQEALANTVVHGCQNDPSKIVCCRVEVDSGAFTITVRDPGPGFDVDAAAQSTEAGVNFTTHGRGICLMRSLMDEVVYRKGGAEVELRKLRSVPLSVA